VAIPFALITILLLSTEQYKHSVNLISSKLADKAPLNTIQTYVDLDNDGYAEEISHFSTAINSCAIKISTKNNILLGQWNFNGTCTPETSELMIFDFDNNGIEDVFTIYNRSDSVFIGGLNPEIDSYNLFEDVFLDRIFFNRDTIHFSTYMQSHDMDNDGYKDVVIALSAGYSEQPRRFIIWNPISNTVKRSESTGIFIGRFSIADIDNDGTSEIIPMLGSYENISESSGIPYNDWYKWFTIYNHELKPEFEPINLGKGNGITSPYLFWQEGRPTLLIMDFNKKAEQRYRFHLYDWNSRELTPWIPDVNLIGELKFLEFQTSRGRRLLIVDQDGYINVLNLAELKFDKNIHTDCKMQRVKVMNINNDSLPELIFSNDKNQICIYSNNFEDHSHIQLPEGHKNLYFSYKHVDSTQRHLIVQEGHNISEYTYEPHPGYQYLVFLIYFSVYLGYVLTIWVIMFGQSRYLKRRYLQEKLIAELKLKSIRNQMDPHFTFNAVNAIASAIFKEDKQNAYSYFSKFSKLIRSTMLYSDRMTRVLDEELDFTLKYLEIEKFRFREKFEYEVKVDDGVNLNMEVPRMIIQAFAESSINNGLMHRIESGLLLIKVYDGVDHLIIEFIDNGVGIERSKELNKDKAFKSAQVMEEFISIFNEFNKSKIQCKMYDVMVDGEVSGTRVDVKIPFNIQLSFH